MGLKDFLENVKENIAQRRAEEEDIPDDVTTDKFLRSLRRQRRRQMEEIEKTRLMRQIKDFEGDKTRKLLFGINERGKKKFKKEFKKKQKDYRFLSKLQKEKKVFKKSGF